jgi:hypothetical protein
MADLTKDQEIMLAERDIAFYVLNPEGDTVMQVVVAGPFNKFEQAEHALAVSAIPNAHIELLLTRKMEAHLAEDWRLTQWLKERTGWRRG